MKFHPHILKYYLPYGALLVAHVIWGMNFVVAKITLEEIPVMTLGFGRFALAAILILPFILMMEKEKRVVRLPDLPKIVAAAMFSVVLNIALFFEGLTRTSAIDASVLTLIIPILSLIICWVFLKEKIYWVNLTGVLLGLCGAITVIGLPLIFLSTSFNPTTLVGNLLIILSSLCFVTGSIFVKKILKTYDPLFITGLMFMIGAIGFLIPAIIETIKNPSWIQQISVLGILGFLYITVLSSVCAYWLMNWGLQKVSVAKANMFQYINPAIAASLAVPLLNERISFSFIIGTCLIILGVYWGTMGKHDHHHIHHRSHKN